MSQEEESITNAFDRICFSAGDSDAILVQTEHGVDAVCYLEIQEYSKLVAYQLWYRFRPDYVLVDCQGHVVAEAVALLACIRLGIPFVPVSASDLHAGRRLVTVVDSLRATAGHSEDEFRQIVIICCCPNERDPLLGIFQQAEVHNFLYLSPGGVTREPILVPDRLPETMRNKRNDDLYVLFTSGTSGKDPKAVVGSHRSTFRRLEWFRNAFDPSPRVARKTRLTFVDGVTELLGTLLHPPSVLVAVAPVQLEKRGIVAALDMNPTQITLTPSQLKQLLLLPKKPVACLERVISSGEPLTAHLFRKVIRVLPDCQFINLYGQTETTGDVLCAVLTDLGPEQAVSQGVVAVGKPIVKQTLLRTDENDVLMVSGNVSNGYLVDGKAMSLGDSFCTNDVGFCSQDGLWYIRGRRDDVAKVNGVLTSPSEAEAAFLEVFGLGDDSVAATIVDGSLYVVSEKVIPNFSRQGMRDSGLPWTLVPKQLLCHPIPVSRSASGKVDRARLHALVAEMVSVNTRTTHLDATNVGRKSIDLVVSDVLQLPRVDCSKSFVELGGDSALAVTFICELRRAWLEDALDVTAVDVLEANSIVELDQTIRGQRTSKRKRLSDHPSSTPAFRPKPLIRVSSNRSAVHFAACVDATPVLSVDREHVYVGCQGGVVQRICCASGASVGCWHFQGWMIQADCVVLENSVVVCASHSDAENGKIVSLNLSLDRINWEREYEKPIRSTPVTLAASTLCVSLADQLVLLDLRDGTEICVRDLPDCVMGRPALDGDVAVYCGSSCLIQARNSSHNMLQIDQLQLPDPDPASLPCGDGVVASKGMAVFATRSGSLFKRPVHRSGTHGSFVKVCGLPLAAPAVLDNEKLVVGSLAGNVYCVMDELVVWSVNVGGCIKARPLVLPDGSCILCTTAGDVVRVRNGAIIWRCRVGAEIWSGAELVDVRPYRVCFGTRDSRVHIVSLGHDTCSPNGDDVCTGEVHQISSS